MNYLLVENKQIVHLGPIAWRHRFIQSELEDLDVDYIVSPTEPNGYLRINDSLEIYPVNLENPVFDALYQQLAGPFWTFDNEVATGTYNVLDRDIAGIKGDLKGVAAGERYRKETSGIKLTVQETEVSVATDRDSRNVYAQKLVSMTDNDTVQWKFPQAWLTLTKQELVTVLNSINAYVQTQFDWEIGIVQQIDDAQDIDTLKNIVIVEKRDNGPL